MDRAFKIAVIVLLVANLLVSLLDSGSSSPTQFSDTNILSRLGVILDEVSTTKQYASDAYDAAQEATDKASEASDYASNAASYASNASDYASNAADNAENAYNEAYSAKRAVQNYCN